MTVTLYRVPWQPSALLRLETLNLLGKASELAGHHIQVAETYRTYDRQKYLYDGWRAGLPGFYVASNPDDPKGQNNHRRGTAIDIANRSDIPFMLQAGFTQDPSEWWHFNLPGAGNFAQINDYTIAETDVANITSIPIPEKEPMIKYFVSNLVTDQPGTTMFGGPGVIPIPLPNPTWASVMTRYADAMNEQDDNLRGKKLRFSAGEWKLIRQALSTTEPLEDLTKAIDKAGM